MFASSPTTPQLTRKPTTGNGFPAPFNKDPLQQQQLQQQQLDTSISSDTQIKVGLMLI